MKAAPDNCFHLTVEIVREIHAEAIERSQSLLNRAATVGGFAARIFRGWLTRVPRVKSNGCKSGG